MRKLDIENIRTLKRHWIDTTLVLALSIPLIAGMVVDDWSIYTNALSRFGVLPITAGIWPIYLGIVSIGLWLNGSTMIEDKYDGIKSHVLSYMLNAACTGLMLTAIITEELRIVHLIVATTFFVMYVVFIFLYGWWQIRSTDFKEGTFSVVISILLLLTTLLMIPFTGLAMFELTYISILLFWNWAVRRRAPIIIIANYIASVRKNYKQKRKRNNKKKT